MKRQENYEEEKKLLEAAQNGSKEAVMALIRRYEPLFRRLAAGETRMDWEDIRQDLVVVFLESLRDFDREKGIYFAWYIRQRLYWAKTRIIRKAMERSSHEVYKEEEEEMAAEDPCGREQPLEALHRALATLKLPPDERKILDALLRGKSVPQILKETGKSRSSYYRSRGHILQRLRRAMEAES
ncbi:sigma-70 family RNA polymerase sigma factor [uncultured Dialister sp.]|uniref:sigma-70 family RNA polymerase sigma factor n=1 Tax=uncultured Dialister sp. TaxID=278064 RepID=UPI0027DE623F|nr:sigma-70 family RNA polymerase sigma factor [uncultured Dialister sp.]